MAGLTAAEAEKIIWYSGCRGITKFNKPKYMLFIVNLYNQNI